MITIITLHIVEFVIRLVVNVNANQMWWDAGVIVVLLEHMASGLMDAPLVTVTLLVLIS